MSMIPIAPPARISFIGMGVMGAAMAANIMKAGFALTVSMDGPKALHDANLNTDQIGMEDTHQDIWRAGRVGQRAEDVE